MSRSFLSLFAKEKYHVHDGVSHWSVINKKDQHRICLKCRDHWYKGKYWTNTEWEEWVNDYLPYE